MRDKGPAAPRRPLNPLLWRRFARRWGPKDRLAVVAGYPCYQQLYAVLHEDRVRATPLTVQRLQRVADAIGFPRDEIFLDGAAR
jgi:hypothetical protein